ncbi:MAG: stage II sporulation protein P, partial [Clostridia bacterium]|nr:stage II sporulation protein P [Clostridia bacterium]
GTYPVGYNSRTTDTRRNVVGVGDVITERLNAAGIVTIHDSTVYDSPAYSGAYGRSQKTVESYLKKYPSIKVILDVHRDAIQQNDGSLLKPTTTINGKKAAQIMLVSGCDDKGTLGFPNWRQNLTFAAHLQQQIVNDHPGLARPIYCWNVRYNAHLSPTALLVEFGSDANTADEVQYSAELFADSLIAMLNPYIKKNG